jgi:replicative DNA helicase
MISIENEFAVVGGIIAGGAFTLYEIRQTGLTVDHLSTPVAIAYRAISDMIELHGAIDKPMLRESIKQLVMDQGEKHVGMTAADIFAQLYREPWSAVTAKHHARKVVDFATLYAARETLTSLIHDVDHWDKSASEFLETGQSALLALSIHRAERPRTFGDCMPEFWERFTEKYESGEPFGLPVPFPRLNRMIRGLRENQLIVIGGPTGSGKTTLVANIACDLGVRKRSPGVIYSLEMDWYQLIERNMFAESQLSADGYYDRTLTADDWIKLREAKDRLTTAPIIVEDNAALTLREIVTGIRKAKIENNIAWVVVDYTQLVNTDQKYESRQMEVTNIIRTLKRTASELQTPIIALTQLNEDGDPRESKAIMHDSDTFLALEPVKDGPNMADQAGVLDYNLNIKKCRGGAKGTVPLVFHAAQTRFEELDQFLEASSGGPF